MALFSCDGDISVNSPKSPLSWSFFFCWNIMKIRSV